MDDVTGDSRPELIWQVGIGAHGALLWVFGWQNDRLTVRYAGRVMSSSVYNLQSVTVPVTADSRSAGAKATRSAHARAITGLRARIA